MSLNPYAALIGATIEDDGVTVMLPFAEEVVGRPGFLHGGAIGGLLELAGRAAVDAAVEGATVDLVTLTVDYLRGGRDRTTWAAATLTRLGRRVANVEASAWQGERDPPIATARLTFAIARG